MDIQTKFDLIRSVGIETVTDEELMSLLETDSNPVVYDGFEPSGLAHLPIGIYRPLLLKNLLDADVKFKLLIADTYAWINDKMDGDLNKIRTVGLYFIEVWKAAGIPITDTPSTGKVCAIWHYDGYVSNPQYWKKVFLVARNHNEARTKRALTIAGRKEDEVRQTAQLFYPSMQCADIFQMSEDPQKLPIIAQMGMDQRKANILAREVAEKCGFKKPVAVHHKMLLGLDGIQSASASDEKNNEDSVIDYKMSKSKPNTSIFVHDTTEQIKEKISKAYCPIKIIQGNPIVQYVEEIIFRNKKEFVIKRNAKFGGDVIYGSYAEFVKDYSEGKIHPMDVKSSVAFELDGMIQPIRHHFETNAHAKKLYEQVKNYVITR